MKTMIQKTGLRRDLLQIHKDVNTFSMVFIRDGYKWIKAIYENIHIECLQIRASVSEEQWASYQTMSAMGTDEFTEVVLMNKALAKLRKAIVGKDRSDFFKREAQRVEARKKK